MDSPRSATKIAGLAVFFLFVASLGAFDIVSEDLGIHLVAGQHTVEHGIPQTNVFSEIHQDHPILQHEWAFQVVTHWIASAFGLAGLAWVRLGIALLIGWLMILSVRGTQRTGVLLAVLGLGLLVAQPRFFWRPGLWSLLFIAADLKLLVDFLEGRRTRLLWLPVVQALWANVHGYFIVGPILIGAALAGEAWALFRRNSSRQRVTALGVSLLLCTAACFATPFFVEGALYPVKTLLALWSEERLIAESIAEMLPPRPYFLHLVAVKAWLPLLGLFLATALAQGRQFQLGYFLMGLAATAMAWGTFRNIGLFGVILGTLSAVQLSRCSWCPALIAGRAGLPLAGASALAMIAGTYAYATNRVSIHEQSELHAGLGYDRTLFAPTSLDFVTEHIPPAPVLNDIGMGSTYLWWFYPDRMPFINGYSSGYPIDFYDEYDRMTGGSISLDEMADRHDLKWAYSQLSSPLARMLMSAENWHPVFMDHHYLVAVRKLPEYAALMERFDLKQSLKDGKLPHWEPTPASTFWRKRFPYAELALAEFLGPTYPSLALKVLEGALRVEQDSAKLWVARGRANLRLQQGPAAMQAIANALECDSENVNAHLLRASMAAQQGDLAAAEQSFLIAIEGSMEPAVHWRNLADLRLKAGNVAAAVEALQHSLESEPDHAQTHLRLGMLYEQQRNPARAREHYRRTLELAPDAEEAGLLRRKIEAMSGR